MTTRDLDTAEVYYEVIDRIWPMNALCLAELDPTVDAGQVDRAWATTTALVPVVGARVERTAPREAHFVFGADAASGPVARYDDVPTALATESSTRVDLAAGPLVRCSLVDAPGGISVVLAAHHAALDGPALAQLALLFARVLGTGDDDPGHPLRSPTVPLEESTPPGHDSGSRRSEMLATARRVRDEDEFVGNADAYPWHDPAVEAERDLCFVRFRLSERASAALIDWARSSGATVHGALSAALLQSLEALTPGITRAALSTTVDLRSRSVAPEGAAIGQAAAVIVGSYATGEDPAASARATSADIRRRVDRGEGELFFTLSGVERLPVGEAADEVMKRWTASATPSVCLGNLGVIPADTAPQVLRGLSIGFAPTPNQAAFVTATTFRDQMSFLVGLDRNRLSIDPEEIATTLRERLLAIPGSS